MDGRLDIFTQTTLRGSICAQTAAQCDAARAHLDSLVFGNGQGSPPPLGAVSGGAMAPWRSAAGISFPAGPALLLRRVCSAALLLWLGCSTFTWGLVYLLYLHAVSRQMVGQADQAPHTK